MVKNPLTSAGTDGNMGSNPGSGRALEEEMATTPDSCWIIPWTEEPRRLQSMGS